MKKIFSIVFIVFLSINTYSQVFGISSAKMASMNATTMTINEFEFEPGYGYYWARSYYDENGKLVSLSTTNDSIEVYQSLVFRFTYGITNKFEAGMMIASDLSSFSFGTKYTLFTINDFSGGIIAGGTFANKSDIVAINSGIFGKTLSFAAGLVFSNEFSDKLSLDFDAQYQCLRDNKVSYSNDIFANAELAYIFKNKNQLIGGFSYTNNIHTHEYDGHHNYLLALNLGISVETGEMFAFNFMFPVAILGKNFDRLIGFNFALTMFLP